MGWGNKAWEREMLARELQPGHTCSPSKVTSSITSCNILDCLCQTLTKSPQDRSGTGWKVQVLVFPVLQVCCDGKKQLNFGICWGGLHLNGFLVQSGISAFPVAFQYKLTPVPRCAQNTQPFEHLRKQLAPSQSYMQKLRIGLEVSSWQIWKDFPTWEEEEEDCLVRMLWKGQALSRGRSPDRSRGMTISCQGGLEFIVLLRNRDGL